MRYKIRCRFAAIEIMGGYLRDSVKQQIGIVVIGFNKLIVKLEFVELFGQWCAVSMRYAALPPALVRGVSLR